VHWTLGGGSGGRLGADAAKVVPGCEVEDGLAHLVGESFKFRRDPLLKPRKVEVTCRQVPVVLE
jgi:hypothetical protein